MPEEAVDELVDIAAIVGMPEVPLEGRFRILRCVDPGGGGKAPVTPSGGADPPAVRVEAPPGSGWLFGVLGHTEVKADDPVTFVAAGRSAKELGHQHVDFTAVNQAEPLVLLLLLLVLLLSPSCLVAAFAAALVLLSLGSRIGIVVQAAASLHRRRNPRLRDTGDSVVEGHLDRHSASPRYDCSMQPYRMHVPDIRVVPKPQPSKFENPPGFFPLKLGGFRRFRAPDGHEGLLSISAQPLLDGTGADPAPRRILLLQRVMHYNILYT